MPLGAVFQVSQMWFAINKIVDLDVGAYLLCAGGEGIVFDASRSHVAEQGDGSCEDDLFGDMFHRAFTYSKYWLSALDTMAWGLEGW